MTLLDILAAIVAIVFLALLVFHVLTWIKGNGRSAKWHAGRVLMDLVLVAVAGGLFAASL